MSLHNLPITEEEKCGLAEHGLPIGKPSQLSDAFLLGMRYQPESEYICHVIIEITDHKYNTRKTRRTFAYPLGDDDIDELEEEYSSCYLYPDVKSAMVINIYKSKV